MKLCILGSTGSIGSNALDIIARNHETFQAHCLCANSNWQKLLEQCRTHRPEHAVLVDKKAFDEAKEAFAEQCPATRLHAGNKRMNELAADRETDTVLAAIVGSAGLEPTLAAVRAGKRILLANKESLVLAGELFMESARQSGAVILPVDSEHSAIFQCLPDACAVEVPMDYVSKIVLTASGGPFREWSADAIAKATVEQACAHPNWSMGRKISVDSATMMNKGLEVIEAHWLFDLSAEQIEVLVHPQSIIHSLVYYRDGSVLAQMGVPDMRTAIAYAMSWPQRVDSGVDELDLARIGQLEFSPPDMEKFPCLDLAFKALQAGQSATACLNAGNEIAVAAFLEGNIPFNAIAQLTERLLEQMPLMPVDSLENILAADRYAREQCRLLLEKYYG